MVQEAFSHPVSWVHPSSHTRFEQSYREIAEALKILGRDDPQQDILRLVTLWLTKPENEPWLMILENADDPGIFFNPKSDENEVELLQYIPQSSLGTVIVTTRFRQAAAIICEENLIEVPSMTSKEAYGLLEKRLTRRIQPTDPYEELLSVLEYLPLAIAQAAASIVYDNITINRYLTLLREDESSLTKLMREPFADRRRDRQVPNSVTATWSLSFDQIRREDLKAVEVLSFMGVLDRQGIPQSLSNHAFSFDRLDFTKILGRLKTFYLIISDKREELRYASSCSGLNTIVARVNINPSEMATASACDPSGCIPCCWF